MEICLWPAHDPESRPGISLRIEIDDENALTHGGKRRPEINRRCRFAHPALLIGDRRIVGLGNDSG